MIMLWHEIEYVGCCANLSHVLGGVLGRFSYAYSQAKAILPDSVQTAYEEGLIKLFERLESLGYSQNGGGDLELFSVRSLYYLSQAIPELTTRTLARVKGAINAILSDYGHKHDGGPDNSYDGIALHDLIWGLRESIGQTFVIVTHNPELYERADRVIALKDGVATEVEAQSLR